MSEQIAGSQHMLSVQEYDDPRIRRLAEGATQDRLAAFVRDAGRIVLDSPVGRWHYAEVEIDGTVQKRWLYRLEAHTVSA